MSGLFPDVDPDKSSTAKEKKLINVDFKVQNFTDSGEKNYKVGGLIAADDSNSSTQNYINAIKPLNLTRKVGKEYNVVIEYIRSPSEFYVTVTDISTKLLEDLKFQLKMIPPINNKNFYKKPIDWFQKEIGSYALYYSKCEELWFRVKIKDWYIKHKQEFVKIFFLDHGEYKCVNINDLQPLPGIFKKYPAFAQECHLYGIFPSDVDESNNYLWGKESIEKMKSLIEKCNFIRIKIASDDVSHHKNSLPVTLWLLDNKNQCVNDILVKENYARLAQPDIPFLNESQIKYLVENETLNNWNPMKEDFESFKNSYDLNINDPAAFIYGYVGKDHNRICSFFGNTGHCFKGMSCRKDHEKFDSLGYTKDLEETYHNSFNMLPNFPIHSILNIEVTCILKFNEFFCITDSSLPSGENLNALFNSINNAENVREMKKLLIPPSSGQIVLAQYSQDDFWYRARILESQPEKDIYRVVYVDYGNEETVPNSKIRAIKPEYLHLPFQAIRCSIAGIDVNPDVPPLEAVEILQTILNNRNITVEVISKFPGELSLHLLVNVFDENGTNVGEELIANKCANFKKELLILEESVLLPG